MRIQTTSSKEENTTDQNGIAKLLEVLSAKFDKMLTKRQLDGQRTDLPEQNIKELSKVVTMKTRWGLWK